MSVDEKKPDTSRHRFNVFFRGSMWLRLREYQLKREKETNARIWLSDLIHAALERYLPVEKK